MIFDLRIVFVFAEEDVGEQAGQGEAMEEEHKELEMPVIEIDNVPSDLVDVCKVTISRHENTQFVCF